MYFEEKITRLGDGGSKEAKTEAKRLGKEGNHDIAKEVGVLQCIINSIHRYNFIFG